MAYKIVDEEGNGPPKRRVVRRLQVPGIYKTKSRAKIALTRHLQYYIQQKFIAAKSLDYEQVVHWMKKRPVRLRELIYINAYASKFHLKYFIKEIDD